MKRKKEGVGRGGLVKRITFIDPLGYIVSEERILVWKTSDGNPH